MAWNTGKKKEEEDKKSTLSSKGDSIANTAAKIIQNRIAQSTALGTTTAKATVTPKTTTTPKATVTTTAAKSTGKSAGTTTSAAKNLATVTTRSTAARAGDPLQAKADSIIANRTAASDKLEEARNKRADQLLGNAAKSNSTQQGNIIAGIGDWVNTNITPAVNNALSKIPGSGLIDTLVGNVQKNRDERIEAEQAQKKRQELLNTLQPLTNALTGRTGIQRPTDTTVQDNIRNGVGPYASGDEINQRFQDSQAKRVALMTNIPDTKDTGAYSGWYNQTVEEGLRNQSENVSDWATWKLKARKNELEAKDEEYKNSATKDNIRAWDDEKTNLQRTNTSLYNMQEYGLDISPNQYLGVGWLKVKGRPDDYGQDEDLDDYYDLNIYDTVYGDGAFQNAINENMDNYDAIKQEASDLWDRLENGTLTELNETSGRNARIAELTGMMTGKPIYQYELEKINQELANRAAINQYVEGAGKIDESQLGNFTAPEYRQMDWVMGTPNAGLVRIQDKSMPYTVNGDEADEAYVYIKHPQAGWQDNINDSSQLVYFMPDEWKDVFLKYYESGDKASAQAFYDAVRPTLESRRSEYRSERDIENAKGAYGLLYSAADVLMKPVEGILGTISAVGTVLGNKYMANPNSDINRLSQYSANTRGARAEVWGDAAKDAVINTGKWLEGAGKDLKDSGKLTIVADLMDKGGKILQSEGATGFVSDAAKVANGIAYSLADNVYAMAITAGLGSAFDFTKASKVAEVAMQTIMSTEATAGSFYDNIVSGREPVEAAILAIGDGFVEAGTEKIKWGHWIKMDEDAMLKGAKAVWNWWNISGVTEGGEEIIGNIGNAVLDKFVSAAFGHKSELESKVEKLQETEHISTDEAWGRVMKDFMKDTALAGLSGYVSGMVLGAGNIVAQNIGIRSAGKSIRTAEEVRGKTGTEQLVDAALGMNKDTLSYKIARELKSAQENGVPVSDYQVGRLAMNVYNETSQSIGNVAKDIVLDQAKASIQALGVKDADAPAAAIAKAVVEGMDSLSKSERAEITGSDAAMTVMQGFMQDRGQQLAAEVKVAQETAKARSIRETVNQLTSGKAIASAASGAVRDSYRKAEIADPAAIMAASGKKSVGVMDALQTGEDGTDRAVTITAINKDGTIQIKTENGTETVDAGDVVAGSAEVAALLRFAKTNTGLITNSITGADGKSTTDYSYANAVLQEIAKNGGKAQTASFLDDAIKIRMRAFSEGAMPKTNISTEAAQALWTAAKSDFDAMEAQRTAVRTAIKENAGTMTFMGGEYGSKRFEEQIKRHLTKSQQNEARVLGEISKRMGFQVELINDTENTDIFGWEDRGTGKITINMAGDDGNRNRHSIITTAAHEMTHWIEQNSREGYAALREYVFDGLRKQGVDVDGLIMNKMESYAAAGQDVDMGGAIAEIVADSCGEVLGSETMAAELKKVNPNLYSRVKELVRTYDERAKEAFNAMRGSSSYEARQLRSQVEELSRIWLGAKAEGMGTGATGVNKTGSMSYAVQEKGNKNGSLPAAADIQAPALTSETAHGSLTSEDSLTPYERYVKYKESKKLIAEEKRLDDEYMQAIRDGDKKKQLEMLRKKIKNTSGIYPFYAPHMYKGEDRDIALAIKDKDPQAIKKAAKDMAEYVPDEAVLIPMPGHTGKVTNNSDTMLLANEISKLTGKPVLVALEGVERESRHTAKVNKKDAVTADQMGIKKIAEIPDGKIPIVIDNVVAVGETAKAAIDALGNIDSTVLSYAKGLTDKVVKGLKAAQATKDKNKNWVHYHDKINPNKTEWYYSVRQNQQAQQETDRSNDVRYSLANKRTRDYLSMWGRHRVSEYQDMQAKILNKYGLKASDITNGNVMAEDRWSALGISKKDQAQLQNIAREMDRWENYRVDAMGLDENDLGAQYVEAWYNGDRERMDQILMEKMTGTDGVIPYKAPHWYNGAMHQWVSNAIKEGNEYAIKVAATEMANLVPKNAVLVPMPPHTGVVTDTTDTMLLAKQISELTGRPVIAALEGVERQSRKASKEGAKSRQITAEDMGFRQVADIPEGTVPIFIDNVVGSGVTAQAAHNALGQGVTLAYAKSTRAAIDGLKNAAPTYYDPQQTYLIPLEDRFDMSQKGVKGTKYAVRNQADQAYMQAVESGDTTLQQMMVDEAAKAAGYTDKAYHGTRNFGFTEFNLDKGQGTIFVAYDKDISKTYADNADVRNVGNKNTYGMTAEQLSKELQRIGGMKYDNKDVNSAEYVPQEKLRSRVDKAISAALNGLNGLDWKDTASTRESIISEAYLQSGILDKGEIERFTSVKDLAEYLLDRVKSGKMSLINSSNILSYILRAGINSNKNISATERSKMGMLLYDLDQYYKYAYLPEHKDGSILIKAGEYNEEYIISKEKAADIVQDRIKKGIYQLYTKPGRQLIVDANNNRWNGIEFNLYGWEKRGNDLTGYRYVPTDYTWDENFNIEDYDNGEFDKIPKANTRDVAAWAKAHGYDSVRINNVHDSGTWGAIGHGSIGIFFNPNDVKSADAVTYDEEGNVIPLSERFNKEQPDIRYAVRNAMDMDVATWMESLSESQMQTEAEKKLLQDYKALRMKQSLNIKRQSDTQNKISKLENYAKERELTQEEKRELSALKIKLQNAKNAGADIAEQLYQVTSSEGYAGLMYQQSKVMDDYITGKTQGELNEAVDDMTRRADEIQARLQKQAEELGRIAESAGVQRVRSYLGASSLREMAGVVKKAFGSTISNKELEAALAEIALKRRAGEPYMEDVQNLAGRVMETVKGERDSDLARLRGTTITISEEQLQEMIGQRYNMKEKLRGLDDKQRTSMEKKIRNEVMKELRGYLAGTGIKIAVGERSTLVDDLSNFREEFGAGIINEDAGELDVLDEFLKWVQKRKEQSKGSAQYQLDPAEVIGVIIGAANNVIYKEGDTKADRDALAEAVTAMQGEVGNAIKAINGMMKSLDELRKSGHQAQAWTAALQRDAYLAIGYYNKIARMAQETAREKKLRDTIAQLKSEAAQKLAKNNEEWRELIARDKQARETAEDIGSARRKIHTDVSRLYRLLSEPKGLKNIPEHLQGLARELIRIVVDNDLSEMRHKISNVSKKQLEEVRRRLTAWEGQNGPFSLGDLNEDENAPMAIINSDLDEIYRAVEEWNGEIRGKNKADTLAKRHEIIKRMQEAVTEIYSYIRSGQDININRKRIAVEDAADAVREGTGGKKYREWTGKAGRVISGLHKAIVSGNMTPEYFFRNLGNKGLSDLWEGYHEAENRNGLELAKARDRLAEIAEKHGYKNWDMNQKIRLQLDSGDVTVTLGQLMSLYATWKRENTLGPEMSQHLYNGGFYAEQDTKDGLLGRAVMEKKAHRIAKDEESGYDEGEKFGELLTDEQKAFVDDVVGFLSDDMSKLGNEASMKAYGIKMYKEKYYFPFQIWDGVKARKSNEGAAAAGANDRAFHPSFSKSRMHGAGNALVIGDFIQTAADHIAGMINYATMGLANENLQKVLNYTLEDGEPGPGIKTKRNVRAMLEEAYGREAMQYLAELQKQLNGGAVKTSKSFGDKAISMFRKNAVAGSMSVAMQQPLSYIRAAVMINPKYLLQGLAKEYWNGAYQERMKYSGVSVIKDMGRFDMNFGESARDYLMPEGNISKAREAWNTITEYSTILPELMDRWTWTRMWVAVKAEQHAQNPDMDIRSDEFLEKCAVRFNDLMRRTQVYDSTLVKSQNMRSDNYWIKNLTSFMAEPTVSANVLADAVRMVKNHEAGGKGILAGAAAIYLLSAIFQAAVKAAWSSGRSPDDKKTWLENFLNRFGTNLISETDPLQLIPGYSDLITLLKKGELSDDAMGAIGKLVQGGRTGIDMLLGNAKDPYRAVEDSVGQITQLLTNLPAKNLMRDVRAIYNWILGDKYAQRNTSSAVLKYQALDAIHTADNLIGWFNQELGAAGYETKNAAYYQRIYDARKAGNQAKADEMTEYLVSGRGVKPETINTQMNTLTKNDDALSAGEKASKLIDNGYSESLKYIKDQYKNGELKRDQAEELYRKVKPAADDKTIHDVFDEIDYEQATGREIDNYTNYTPLYDAIDAGDMNAADKRIKDMVGMGYTEKNIVKEVKEHVKKKYKEGAISREQAEKLIKKYDPDIQAKTLANMLDGIDYEAENPDVDGATYTNYTPLHNALSAGDKNGVATAKAKLKQLGYKETDINKEIRDYVTDQYKNGEIKRAEAENRLKNYGDMTADEAWWKIDRIDFKKQTGKDPGAQTYYRLYDAIEKNRSTDINYAIKVMTEHGIKKENIKKQLGEVYEKEYLAADSAGKVKLKNAIELAYKALGYTTTEADKTINSWGKTKKKGK